MEEKIGRLEEEGMSMRGEIWDLRDRLEEEENSKMRLEQKSKRLEVEEVSLKEEVAKEKVGIRKDGSQPGTDNLCCCVVLTDSNS